MTTATLDTVVRLTHDVPDLWLSRGDVGVVQSIWMAPANCFEVEFRKPSQCTIRALLKAELLEVVEPVFVTAVQEI